MKKSVGPNTVLQPHPVLIVGTYGADGKPNIMAASWGGICCSKPPCVSVSLREATLTHSSIRARKAFTVSIPSEKHVKHADFAGIVSGRDTDKFAKAGLTAVRAGSVDAPYVGEFPFALECRLVQEHVLGLHTLFVGEIIDVVADEEVLGEHGLPDIEKVKPIIWGGGGSSNYYGIGTRLARAFSSGRDIGGK